MIVDPLTLSKYQGDPGEINKRVPMKVLGQDDFLQLLVTQMRNQDPMSPMADTEFIAQMAQFTTLEQSRQMGEDMAQMRSQTSFQQGVGLLNQQVTVKVGEGDPITGIVTELKMIEGEPQLLINSGFYALQDVIHVKATDGSIKTQSEE
jgi:flagellar basal-body rod modification protein FlgD